MSEHRTSAHTDVVDWLCGTVLENGVTRCNKPVKFLAKISDVQPCFIHECRLGHTVILEKIYPLLRLSAYPGSDIVYGEIAL